MIDLIRELPWTPYGIQCSDSAVAHRVHKFLREAVLDRHIYVSKVIGFSIETNNTFRASTGDYITRHEQIGESYPELMLNLQDKVFLNAGQKYLDVVLKTGINTTLSSQFEGTYNQAVIEVLYEKPVICRCLKRETILRVALSYDCGYMHMSDTCKNLEKKYFPCNTNFSIAPFFRVLPMEPDATLIPIRYYNGATEAQLKNILSTWSIHVKTGNIKEEESLWLQSFGH